MEKLLVHYAAALLTQAACGNAGSLPVSADLSDAAVRAKNLQVWETHRVFYRAIVAALSEENPETGWPAPKGIGLGGLAATLGPLLAEMGLSPELLQVLLSRLLPSLPDGARLPDPGTAK